MKISEIAIEVDLPARDVANALYSSSLVEQAEFLNSYLGFLAHHGDFADIKSLSDKINGPSKPMLLRLFNGV